MTHETREQGGGRQVRFVPLTKEAMEFLRDSDTASAGAVAGVELPDYFVTEGALWLWRYRLGQIEEDAAQTPWVIRQAVVGEDGNVVGHAGFHGPPDADGMVEVAYSVVPAYRRRGYARAMLAELLRRAGADPAVRTVRAAISPDNAGSLATVEPFGFVHTGEQWDEIDGRELLYELELRNGEGAA
ncbi:GNAT family N-acetyltransferase [Streptomyces sp. NPDC048172]|uniref:GNAT family N-acetyltransferase n=1 Tax=Streptomyces sp. NPDC048172 TaxID=3365505 RepID=UPI00371B7BA8